ncbi:MAG: hypothetical protein GAK29_04184 [Acinetobacter bereziniae]|uniref:Uncharacterized protein n=1 Tax=Acinetobacter bereziniae TaxID=106648 RepID=A0A833PB69_ACIBZ|nr:MAG: hypothetical protein GAK29_04184 [Acinetobacter bereziniae]
MQAYNIKGSFSVSYQLLRLDQDKNISEVLTLSRTTDGEFYTDKNFYTKKNYCNNALLFVKKL